ncbi:aminoacyl-tRNA hydrolase [Niveibacterium sp. SC-1]|uniref:aminoacyl-tRNA hydrolase n=1 Tax=Niveibacterium sp. SC-1 TaxID=3135646 RepID=UPI00311D4FB2
MTQAPPKLIVGLGNPGPEYVETRHNAGFWFCEQLARELGMSLSRESRFHGLVGISRQHGVTILLPQTFMNRSGLSVVALAHFYRILPSEILVVHDELDIPPGQLRMKCGGGNGGHNGLKDISAHLSTPDYWRLRIGIGHPGDRNQVADYVLHRPRKEEQALIDESIERALATWPLIARGEWERATQQLNSKPKPKTA